MFKRQYSVFVLFEVTFNSYRPMWSSTIYLPCKVRKKMIHGRRCFGVIFVEEYVRLSGAKNRT